MSAGINETVHRYQTWLFPSVLLRMISLPLCPFLHCKNPALHTKVSCFVAFTFYLHWFQEQNKENQRKQKIKDNFPLVKYKWSLHWQTGVCSNSYNGRNSLTRPDTIPTIVPSSASPCNLYFSAMRTLRLSIKSSSSSHTLQSSSLDQLSVHS